MQRLALLAVLLSGLAAWGQDNLGDGPDANAHAELPPEQRAERAQHHAQHEEKEDKDVAGVIVHHVSDSNEYEFDVPYPFYNGHNPVIHLPIIRIPLKAGACPASEEEEASLKAGCLDLSITKHVFMMWGGTLLLLLVFLGFAHKDKNQLVPRGPVANLLEMLVLFIRNEVAIPNIGKEEGPRYVPYILSVFFFVLFLNLFGLIPFMSTPTANLGVTVALAACTFVLTQTAALRSAGILGYLKHLDGGAPFPISIIMVPIEILSLFTKPFALTMRLFANMLAGHIVIFSLLGLIFILNHATVALISVPFAMAIYFLELFVCFVQAYVFAMLSAVFIGMGVAMGNHGHGDHGDHEAHPAEH